MTLHHYIAKARQYDAQQAGERYRLAHSARQNRTAHRHRTGSAAQPRLLARLIFRRSVT
jgi:hypothetical protein